MLKWLKRVIRNWLLEENKSISKQIKIYIDTRMVLVTAVAVCGMRLKCVGPDGMEQLIDSNKAVYPEHFWNLWKDMSDMKLKWPDGTDFEPI